MSKKIKFTLESNQRPKLAQEIGEVLGTAPHYKRVPSCAYDIGEYRLDKEGVLHIPEGVAEYTIMELITHLRTKGFKDDVELGDDQTEEKDRLTIAIRKEEFTDTALERLQKIIKNKQVLFQRAFLTHDIRIEISEDMVSFPWFEFRADADETEAYAQFITKLCDMSKQVSKVSEKVTETDNDKYAFRCFLLRLGFIGKEYKTARKILLRNLTGNSAFRYGE